MQTGVQCKAFGVGGIMRQPGRLHITWQDDSTLKMDFDAGTQTRLLNFDSAKQPPPEKTWQGHSVAQWEGPPGGQRGAPRGNAPARDPGGGGQGLRGGPAPPSAIFEGGSVKVVTKNFREGYLRKNGVPYSDSATVTEFINRLPQHPNGDNWLVVITVVEDPEISPSAVLHQHTVQARTGRFEVQAVAVQNSASAGGVIRSRYAVRFLRPVDLSRGFVRRANVRNASLTARAFGKRSATSGSSRTMLVPPA